MLPPSPSSAPSPAWSTRPDIGERGPSRLAATKADGYRSFLVTLDDTCFTCPSVVGREHRGSTQGSSLAELAYWSFVQYRSGRCWHYSRQRCNSFTSREFTISVDLR